MTKIDVNKELLQRVAANARLKLSEKELEEFLPQFKEILSTFSKLDALNTDGVKPSVQPTPVKNVLRKDEVRDCLTVEQALSNTKHRKENYFKGPKAV